MGHGTQAQAVSHQLSVRSDIRVAIVDSRRLIVSALADMLSTRDGIAVVATGACGGADLTLVADHEPDAVIVGTRAQPGEAIQFAAALRRLLPLMGIVFLADELDSHLVEFVVGDEHSGLLLTDVRPDQIRSCLGQVVSGSTVLPSGWHRARTRGPCDLVSALSQRQAEVLRLLADGLSYGEIATHLFISVNTVKFHVKAIFLALGVRNRTAASRVLTGAVSVPPIQVAADHPKG